MDNLLVKQFIPIQVACSIYDDAKFLMSKFYYDCISKFISRNDFQYMQMDTDSAYIALTGEFETLIKPDMKEIWNQEKHQWFPRTDTKENKAYDKRTPGLFKIEYRGEGCVAVSPKLYYVKGFDESHKCSCKGTQKKNNESIMNFETYYKVINNEVNKIIVKNNGFRILKNKISNKLNIYHYEQDKVGLSQKYDKRIVLNDGITTVPLNI
jgi:hypothetical protein